MENFGLSLTGDDGGSLFWSFQRDALLEREGKRNQRFLASICMGDSLTFHAKLKQAYIGNLLIMKSQKTVISSRLKRPLARGPWL